MYLDIELAIYVWYIEIQPNTIDLSNPTNSVVIPQSLVLRSIVLGWILIYQNWSIVFDFNFNLLYCALTTEFTLEQFDTDSTLSLPKFLKCIIALYLSPVF